MTIETTHQNGELPFAKTLFEAADRLRGSVESAEYKHLVLGLIFLKYISDAFDRRRVQLEADIEDGESDLYTEDEAQRAEILEDRDEYISENVFWVPEEARWDSILAAASQPEIGTKIDNALERIERDNAEQLRGVMPRVYARAAIAPQKLGALVDKIGEIGFGENEEEARDLLGRVYEYFIKAFARTEGHRGGEFYTPASVTRLIVEMLQPYEGRVLDPACGSGGLFVQSARFVNAHGGRPRQISILGQENNQATWRICKMNLAIHGMSGDIRLGNSLLDDKFAGVRADFVMANPPFNMKAWGADQVSDDARWAHGVPPDSNANFAWIQHFIHHLAPSGRAGFVMANGSLSSTRNNERSIREQILRAGLVDCIVALPGQLFFTTPIPVCLWFIDRDKGSGGKRGEEILFIDARALGRKVSRTQIELAPEEVARIAEAYHAWRGNEGFGAFKDVPGFAKSAALDEVEAHDFNLTPGRYVGTDVSDEVEGLPFDERIGTLREELEARLHESDRLREIVLARLGELRGD
jgi:type I restriction enzyme M protein